MKKMIKLKAIGRIAGICALAALIMFSFAACGDDGGGDGGGGGGQGGGSTNSALIGKWWFAPAPTIEPYPVFDFRANGIVYFSGEGGQAFGYTATSNKITLEKGMGSANYSIRNDPVDGPTLSLTNCTVLFIAKDWTDYYKH